VETTVQVRRVLLPVSDRDRPLTTLAYGTYVARLVLASYPAALEGAFSQANAAPSL
jgi:hypothetical protein